MYISDNGCRIMYWMAWHYFTTVDLTPNSRVRFHKVWCDTMSTLFFVLKGQDPGRGARQSSEGLWCVTFHWRTALPLCFCWSIGSRMWKRSCEKETNGRSGVSILSSEDWQDDTKKYFGGVPQFCVKRRKCIFGNREVPSRKLNPPKTQCQSKTCLGGRLPMDLNDEIAHPGPFLNRSGRYAGDFRDQSSWLF